MIEQVLSLLLNGERFFLTTHVRPDGDALGSQVALGLFLKGLGKEVTMINSDPLPYNLFWLPGADEVEVFDGSLRQRERIGAADVIIIADTNALERLGKVAGPVENSTNTKLLIDHHTHPEKWFDVTYRRESASSTGELVYELIAAYDRNMITPEIATALYTAIMTDTGSFRYDSVTPTVHRTVADILELGDIRPAPIHISLYDTRSIHGLKLLSRALESVTLCYDGQVGYMVLALRVVRESGASLDETEGFVNYVLSIEGVNAALLFTETDSGTKVSFRSKGNTFVHEWARAFGGGGHRNASGAYIRRPLDEVIREVLAVAPRFMDLKDTPPEDEGVLSPEDEHYLSILMDRKTQESQ